MKSPTASAILSIAALGSFALASVTMKISRDPEAIREVGRRQHLGEHEKRATITESLINNFTGGQYVAQVTVGTPPQKLNLALDTGSSDCWVMSSTADLCNSPSLQRQFRRGGCQTPYTSAKSSTFKVAVKDRFNISYVDGSGATGDYIKETLVIGGASIKQLQMGIAYKASLPIGLLGIGYTTNEASNAYNRGDPFIYPSIIDEMVSQGLINTRAYSLYLDDLNSASGSIIFGGLDSDKYIGSLFALPVVKQQYRNGTAVYATLAVEMTSFGVTGQDGTKSSFTSSSFRIPAILDSGTTLSYIPTVPAAKLYSALGAVDDTDYSGQVFVDCDLRASSSVTFDYGFGGSSGVVIRVPISEMILDVGPIPSSILPRLSFTNVCILGVQTLGDEGPFLLGDTFLRSAYVVYDLENNMIAVAQTNFDSSKSNVVEFQVGQTAIPNVSGIASAAQITNTATGLPGVGTGAARTITVTQAPPVTITASPGTKNGGKTSVPAFDSGGFVVLGISSVLALLGGSWFLA